MVGFFQGNELRKVSLDGRPPVTLCTFEDGRRGGSWGPDETVVFGTNGSPGLWRVSANGGDPEPVAQPGADDTLSLRWSDVLPDGRTVLATEWSGLDSAQIAVVDLDSGDRQVLTAGTFPRYSTTGHIVYWREDALWAMPFDADRHVLTGAAVPVLRNVGVNPGGLSHFAVSRTGTLTYLDTQEGEALGTMELTWVDREGRGTAIPVPPGFHTQPRISPDGSQVVSVAQGDSVDLWVHDVARGTNRRLTDAPEGDRFPVWMPDGSKLAFSSRRTPTGVYWRTADGTGEAELLAEGNYRPTDVTPDGSQLLLNGSGGINVLALEGDGTPMELINSEALEQHAVVSPDGQWIGYVADGSGENEVYVRPFPDVESGLAQLSSGGGWGPQWAPDGRALYFRNGVSLMRVAVTNGPPNTWGNAEPQFKDPYYFAAVFGVLYDIAPDGERFVMAQGSSDDVLHRELIVVERWSSELRELAPVN